MLLWCKDFTVLIDEKSGSPLEIKAADDLYGMNWLRSDYPWGSVMGFRTQSVKIGENTVTVFAENSDKSLTLTVKRHIENGKYYEDYTIKNVSNCKIRISEKNAGIVFPYNCLFDKKENMLHTRCNSHIWCADDICNIQSVKLDGKAPFFIQRAVKGAFSGYGLLCDIAATANASADRGSIVLYPEEVLLEPQTETEYVFEFYFNKKKEILSPISADKYSAFLGEEITVNVDWNKKISSFSATENGKELNFIIRDNKAYAKLKFDSFGEKKILFLIDGKKTFINLNVLRPIDEILVKRARFITEKQQYLKSGDKKDGAYLIYDRESDLLYCDSDFADNNCARERLSMGTLVAFCLSRHYDEKAEKSLIKHREFIEREILDVNTGFVNDGIDDNSIRLYNFPWVSTYYLEWYNLSKEKECLLIAARVLHKYYELGGAGQESPCIEAYEILKKLKTENLLQEYEQLKAEFISHGDSIYNRRTQSTSHEVACANGMMNLMGTFLFQVYLITKDPKYLTYTDDLLKISESFFDLQPDYRMYGIPLRYWDLYWFGKMRSYGDTFPQWLSTLTAQMYLYCDKATKSDHTRIIRENLLGNCCAYFENGFASCGYLYPKSVKVFSSKPNTVNNDRPLGEWEGEKFDDFANDQDWSLYYAAKYLQI